MNILRCSALLCTLFLRILLIRGSPASTEGLGTENTNKSIPQTKAEEIVKYMNESVNPCDDFYEFACGNYKTFNPASKIMPNTNFLQTLRYEHDNKIKLLLTADDDAADTIIDKGLKSVYKSCLNLPTMKNDYAKQLKDLISEFGQMPALEGDKWREEEFDWSRTVAKIAFAYDLKILVNFEIATDFANNTVNRLYLSEPEFELPISIYLEKKLNELALAVITKNKQNLETFLGLEDSVASAVAVDNWFVEKSLAKAMYDPQSDMQMANLYKLNTIDEAHQKYSDDLEFKQLLNITFGTIPNLMIYLQHAYLGNLNEVVKSIPKKMMANYIFSKLIQAFIFDIDIPAERLEQICNMRMKTYFYKHLDNMVYRKYNTKATEEGINHMWLDMKSVFQNLLETQKLNWIAADTRKYAVEKVNAMKLDIRSYAENNFAKEMEQLKLDDQDYIGNLKSIMSSRAVEKREIDFTVPQPPDFGKIVSSTPAYNTMENTVIVPILILNPNSTWSASFPNAVNYAALGFLLSHELIHGFDAGGRTFDAHGNNREWWDTNSVNDFNIRSKCFLNQYKEYIFAGQHLVEMANQNENIADNGGVRLAYEAYLQWYTHALDSQRNEEALDGKNFSHIQYFFISFAQLWCSDLHPDYTSFVLASDQHVPEKLRVIGSLSNFKEFSRAFNCPAGSAMNPTNKCEIY